MEDVRYRLQKVFGTVVLQKIHTRDRRFQRYTSQLRVPPASTHDAVVDVDVSTASCLCPVPEPPRLLPDTSDSCTQVDFHAVQALDDWCSVMTDFSSDDILQRAFVEAKIEAQTYFDFNAQLLTEVTGTQQKAEILRAQLALLLEEKKQVRHSLDDPNSTHNALMAHLLAQTEQIGDFRLRLPAKQPLLPLLRALLLKLSTDLADDDNPDATLYHFLCADQTATAATLNSNANTLLR